MMGKCRIETSTARLGIFNESWMTNLGASHQGLNRGFLEHCSSGLTAWHGCQGWVPIIRDVYLTTLRDTHLTA
ncbi:hypothetical protein RS130_19695 [Paraglaciecola aquimarina]|uniref:Uncharacterized protein n=1 Tax=Paraglaciecola aquimarina TaxID=1235557 RepID=A0ABU3T0N7_9ALTE|nr:hypothetical protein [Paraglaciecola aquimarina]MDU0355815.1 hypothetical protein [Paraglaciecola aquimarina]